MKPNKLRLVFILLFSLIFFSSCGFDLFISHHDYIEDELYRPYGMYELSPEYSTLGCAGEYHRFLDDNYGYVLKPTYSYISIIPSGHDSLEVFIEDLDLYVTAHYDYSDDVYYGSFYNSATLYDCEIEETIDLWIEDTGFEIYFDVANSFYNDAIGSRCPLYSGDCENIISFTGYPM